MTRTSLVGRAAVALMAAVSMGLAISSSASAAEWQYFNTDADALWDISAIDNDGNGVYDDSWFDLDNDGAWDTRLYNTRYTDALLEVIDFDMDENDEVEIRLSDGDQRPGFDYVWFDWDQNGAWDPWRGYERRIVPRSNIDAITASNRRNVSSAMMHRFRMRTGMSLLYPSTPSPY
jgi:hypothetical protein